MCLLVPAHPSSPGQWVIKWLLLLLFSSSNCPVTIVWGHDSRYFCSLNAFSANETGSFGDLPLEIFFKCDAKVEVVHN